MPLIKFFPGTNNFYPRSPCGERPFVNGNRNSTQKFLSTLSLRRATIKPIFGKVDTGDFYPRSPCGERLKLRNILDLILRISIHALLAESDVSITIIITCTVLFLSTLSLRRATLAGPSGPAFLYNFYPRSPCGERLLEQSSSYSAYLISIHALLAESDSLPTLRVFIGGLFLSTLSLRRATSQSWAKSTPEEISIHALLAESDDFRVRIHLLPSIFLSTLSLRRATRFLASLSAVLTISIHALLAESDCGFSAGRECDTAFLSTLSLRRATEPCRALRPPQKHFYPRSPCGERLISIVLSTQPTKFLSTLSLRRATIHYDNYNLHCVISIHALLAESDLRLMFWPLRAC